MAVLVGILLVAWIVMVLVSARPDSGDLTRWLPASRSRDWSIEAARGNPEGQFLHGLSLIRTNLIIMIDRIPYLSDVAVFGRRFEKITYQIDNSIDTRRLEEARGWIEQSAAKGFAPAIEAKKLFPARTSTVSPGGGGRSTNGPAGE